MWFKCIVYLYDITKELKLSKEIKGGLKLLQEIPSKSTPSLAVTETRGGQPILCLEDWKSESQAVPKHNLACPLPAQGPAWHPAAVGKRCWPRKEKCGFTEVGVHCRACSSKPIPPNYHLLSPIPPVSSLEQCQKMTDPLS